MKKTLPKALLACLLATVALGDSLANESLKRLEVMLPRAAEDCRAARTNQIANTAVAIEAWAAKLTWADEERTPAQAVDAIRELVDAKQHVDTCLDKVLAIRGNFVRLPAGKSRRESLRQYLRVTSKLIDLSGRMRYLLRDAVDEASYDLSPYPQQIDVMIDLLTERQVSIGAMVMSYVLFDPAADSDVNPFPVAIKKKVLRLIAVTKQIDVLPDLADFVLDEKTPAELVIDAAEVIREIGLPQVPPAGQQEAAPAITAQPLRDLIARIDPTKLNESLRRRREQLLSWLDGRIKRGIRDDVFRFGKLELRSGDWLLMRNPSPYNSFTDLAPGLFTHVGVVSEQTDKKGIRRFVIVDLPERGDRIPAITIDAYLQRTLHYFFLRHHDEKVQLKMGHAAGSMVGNETQFDLTFRTERVLALKGQPLAGKRINTYCAGFLLLCAQETGAPRDEFFPIPERRAGGFCDENLAKLGISVGDSFISPTGAVFSPHLKLVGRREPMYSPAREVKESIYDYFAQSMVDKKLTLSPTTYQGLREKLAGLSKFNPWLAKALAKTNNVSEHMDLQAAAKTATVIETLDQIADANRDGLVFARQAFVAGPINELADEGFKHDEIERIKNYRARHQDLFARWLDGDISPRRLRIELVEYYQQRGKHSLDEQFFSAE